MVSDPGPFSMKRTHIPFILVLLFCVTACATTMEHLPKHARVIDDVPYFEQDDFQCGPAALATAINYWYARQKSGKQLSIDTIVAAIYSPNARGVLGLDLETYAIRLGFNIVRLQGEISGIKRSVDDRTPVIVLVDYGGAFHQQNHFMVAKGYTDDGVIFNSGRKEDDLIPNDTLQRIWKKTNFWALIIKP